MKTYLVRQVDYVAVRTDHEVDADSPLDALLAVWNRPLDNSDYKAIWEDQHPSEWNVESDDKSLLSIHAPRGQEHLVEDGYTRTGFVGFRRRRHDADV